MWHNKAHTYTITQYPRQGDDDNDDDDKHFVSLEVFGLMYIIKLYNGVRNKHFILYLLCMCIVSMIDVNERNESRQYRTILQYVRVCYVSKDNNRFFSPLFSFPITMCCVHKKLLLCRWWSINNPTYRRKILTIR